MQLRSPIPRKIKGDSKFCMRCFRAVPADRRVKDKEIEKIDKYQDLSLEIQQLWNMRTAVIPVIPVIPIVVGALGVVSTAFQHLASRLNLPN